MKKILFDTGTISKELSSYIGIKNIEYYVDNILQKVGMYFHAKKILSAERLNADQKEFEIVVAASDEYEYQIARQLDSMQINYSSYTAYR